MADVIMVFIGLIAAVAPGYIAILNHYNNAEDLLRECILVRKRLASKLAKCECRDSKRIYEAMASAPCEYLEREVVVVRSTSIISLFLVIVFFVFYITAASEGSLSWQMFFILMAVIVPYLILFSATRGLPADLLTDAAIVATEGC